MYARIDCMAMFRLQELRKYLKEKGYFCFPCFHNSMRLYCLIRNKNKHNFERDIDDYDL